MPSENDIKNDYSQYRIKRAKEDLEAAHLLFDNGNMPC
jgi:hypothetical protein